MFTFVGFITALLACSNGQMRPSNWNLDVMRFDQNDWNKFDRDFGSQNRKPFPTFRSNRIPTQQPPIVGQIPGQIGGQGGQKGQSGNDNVPPPLPPMPRVPGVLPTPSQPPPPLRPGKEPEKPMDNPGDEGNWNRQPPLGPEMVPELPASSEAPPDQNEGVEPQSQVPPPAGSNKGTEGEDMGPGSTEATSQSEIPPSMIESSGEKMTTILPSVSTIQNDDSGFSFGVDMDDFPTFVPPQENIQLQIDQRNRAPTMGQVPMMDGAATSEQKNVIIPPPRGKFEQIPRRTPEIQLKSVLRQGDMPKQFLGDKNVPRPKDLDNSWTTPASKGLGSQGNVDRVDGHLIGVVRSPRGK